MTSTFQASSSQHGGVSFRSPNFGPDYYSTKQSQKQAGHFKRMSMITGKQAAFVNEQVSPYSILRNSSERDVDGTIEKITVGSGARTNRA